MKNRLFVSVVHCVCLLALLGTVAGGCDKEKPAVFSTSGTVEGKEVNVSSMIAGRIESICCREGDAVRKDQLLVELESDELKASVAKAKASVEKARADIEVYASSIESARADVAGFEAKIKSASAEVEKSDANLAEAKLELERAETLVSRNAVSKASYDLAKTAYRTSLANVDAAGAGKNAAVAAKAAAVSRLKNMEDQLVSARANLKVAEAEVDLSMAKLAQARILSPMDATIVYLALEKGEIADPGVALMTLVDLSNLYVRVDVEETAVPEISLQAPVQIRVQGLSDRTLPGRVVEIGPYGGFATQRDVFRGRQDIKTFRVKIGVDNSDGILKPGMSVVADISLGGRK